MKKVDHLALEGFLVMSQSTILLVIAVYQYSRMVVYFHG